MVIGWPTPPGTPCSGELGARRPRAWGRGQTGCGGHTECQDSSGRTDQVSGGQPPTQAKIQLKEELRTVFLL